LALRHDGSRESSGISKNKKGKDTPKTLLLQTVINVQSILGRQVKISLHQYITSIAVDAEVKIYKTKVN